MAAAKKPTVSVVIPAYNAAEFLGEALDSVLAQTLEPIEVIVVDDGSKDETPRVASSFPGKVTYIRKEHGGGCGGTRNVGIRAASGEWIAFLDADDIWMPGLLEKLVSASQQTGADLVFCDALTLRDGCIGSPTHFEHHKCRIRIENDAINGVLRNAFELLLESNAFILPSAVLIRRDALLQIGLFDESIYCNDDMDLWLRLSLRYRFAVVNEALAYRRIHERNMSHDRWILLTGQIKVYEKLERYAPGLAPSEKWRKILRSQKGPMLRDQGAGYLKRGRLLLARESWAQGFWASYSPRLAGYWLVTFLPQPWVDALRKWKKQTLFAIGYKY